MAYQITKKFLTFFIAAFFMIFPDIFVSAQSVDSAPSANTTIATSAPMTESPSSLPYFLVALAAAFVVAPYGMARILSRKNEKNRS